MTATAASEHDDALDFPGSVALCLAGLVDPPSPSVIADAHAAIRSAARGSDLTSRSPRRGLRLRGGRRLPGAALAVTAVTAALLVYPTVTVNGTRPAASANAAAFLHGVADKAAHGRATDAPYWKVKARYHLVLANANGVIQSKPVTQSAWYGRKTITIQGGNSGACHDGYCTFPAATGGGQLSWTIAGKAITWDDLDRLPTDPKTLKSRLLGDSTGQGRDGILYPSIVQLLATSPAGPALRSALFDVLAGLDGVRLIGPVKDSTGRHGTAVEWQGPSTHYRLIVDPDTGEVLEVTIAIGKLGNRPITTTYLFTGPVQKLG
jgi:hypothetical protein